MEQTIKNTTMLSRVLIVDDNSANLQLAVETLLSDQIQLLATKSGKDALELLQKNVIDLILLDITMPGMDGFETLEKIREIPSCQEVPIIFLTSHQDSETLKKCFNAGAVDFISKPFYPEELTSRVNTHLSLSLHRKNLQGLVDEKTSLLRGALEKLKSSELVKENFLSMMSHELRTPLNGIMGMSQLLRSSEVKTLRDDLLDDLDASAIRLNRLLSDILNFVNIDTVITQSYAIPVDTLNFKDQLELLALQYCGTKNTFSYEFDERIPQELKFDKNSTLKVLECLLNNAFKFTLEGAVCLAVRFIEDGAVGKDCLRFTLKDKGIGIAAENFSKIFEKFFQIDSGINRRYEGAGIGLTFAKKITDSMAGSIYVESEENKGSTFVAELPVSLLTENVKSPMKAVANSTALIVEDIRTNQDYLRRILELAGVTVFMAKDYIECMKTLEVEKVDVLLMDYLLPGKNGAEVVTELRGDEKFAEIPIIGVTAKADIACRQECFVAGMNDFITKPFTAKEVYASLSHFFEMNEHID